MPGEMPRLQQCPCPDSPFRYLNRNLVSLTLNQQSSENLKTISPKTLGDRILKKARKAKQDTTRIIPNRPSESLDLSISPSSNIFFNENVAESVSRAFKNQFNLKGISPLQRLYEIPDSPLFKRAAYKKKANFLPKIDQTKRNQGSSSPEHSNYNFI